jgi:hypothetical protein
VPRRSGRRDNGTYGSDAHRQGVQRNSSLHVAGAQQRVANA